MSKLLESKGIWYKNMKTEVNKGRVRTPGGPLFPSFYPERILYQNALAEVNKEMEQ